MIEPRNPREMRLGEIVEELNLLSSVRTLSVILPIEQAYTRAPRYCRTPEDLFEREKILYAELNGRESVYLRGAVL